MYLTIAAILIKKGYFASNTDFKIRIVLTSILLVIYIARVVMAPIIGNTENTIEIVCLIFWAINVCINIIGIIVDKKELQEKDFHAELEGFEELSPEELINING